MVKFKVLLGLMELEVTYAHLMVLYMGSSGQVLKKIHFISNRASESTKSYYINRDT